MPKGLVYSNTIKFQTTHLETQKGQHFRLNKSRDSKFRAKVLGGFCRDLCSKMSSMDKDEWNCGADLPTKWNLKGFICSCQQGDVHGDQDRGNQGDLPHEQGWTMCSTLLYPISLSSGFWWSSQTSKYQYRDHLTRRCAQFCGFLTWMHIQSFPPLANTPTCVGGSQTPVAPPLASSSPPSHRVSERSLLFPSSSSAALSCRL